MNYKIGNNVVENKIVTCYPVLVVKFNEYKCVYFIKRDLMYFVHSYFFSHTCEEDNILSSNSEGGALTLIEEIKSDAHSEQLINTFVKAAKSYNNPIHLPEAPQYLEHYFSIIRKEHVITTSLMDDKYHTSPENF